jgi:hypothetical protein
MKKVNFTFPRASHVFLPDFFNRQLFLLVNAGGTWVLNAFSTAYISEIQRS